MYLVSIRAQLILGKPGTNQQFKAKDLGDLYAMIVKMKYEHRMRVAAISDNRDDETVYVKLVNDHFTIWYYGIKIENGPDKLIDKIRRLIGLEK